MKDKTPSLTSCGSYAGHAFALFCLFVFALTFRPAFAQTTSLKIDFGAAGTEAGYLAADNTTTYTTARGYGWLSNSGLNLRDRGIADVLRRDFVFTNTVSSLTFRVSGLTPNGKYLMTVLCGDAQYGDHVVTVSVPGAGTLPTVSPGTAQYLELNATVDANASGILDITFGSPTPNWVVNALTLEATTSDITPFIQSSPASTVSEWNASVFASNPIPALLATYDGTTPAGFTPTGLSREDYLTLIASEIDFWKTKQNSSGAIIDPYLNSEIQYSTPAFANAAAALVVYAGRTDLLEPAAKAMDWASLKLHNRQAASSHEDFYPTMLAHAYRLLAPLVTTTRAATWKANLTYDPYSIYRQAIGSMNWNIVSSCGEALFQMMGIRSTDSNYVAESWAAQGRHFTSPYGLYEEGPMAYDHFPRIFLADVIAQGYTGPYRAEVSEALDRAAVTSLFMQSPWGELPAGGRSAHHQWNEAEQCLTYEIYSAKAKASGDTLMAGAYKRAAHLAYSSMQRWVRPSGEMQVVKNWVDPSSRHGFESYSYHSQYNLLPMAMLASAYEYASTTLDIGESAAPADTGGFVFQLTGLHKVFANAGGTYVEIDTTADHHYDATGLIRIHQKGLPPQLGPSDSLLASSSYNSPNPSPITTGVGVSWMDTTGAWRTLGEMGSSEITSVTLSSVTQSPSQVSFDITYSGNLPNVSSITEHYLVQPDGVQLTTHLNGYNGALRYVWPVLANDGRTPSSINVNGNSVSVSQGNSAQAVFTAANAQSVRVEASQYSNHNGWARLGIAEYPNGGDISLRISQAVATKTVYWKGDVDKQWNTNNAGNTNWSSDSAGTLDNNEIPDSLSDVIFTASRAGNPVNTQLGTDISLKSLTVNSNLAVGISGSQNLTLGEGGITMNANGGALTLNTTGQVILATTQGWTNNSSNILLLDSPLSTNGGDLPLDLQGSGTFAFAQTSETSLNILPGVTFVVGDPSATDYQTLNVTQNFTLASGATLQMKAAGGGLGDKLIVGGKLTASGTVHLVLNPSSPAPDSGDQFDLFDASTTDLASLTLDLPTLAPGLSWDTSDIVSGIISITGSTNGYITWAATHPFTTGTEGPSFDADHDGIPNVFEWLLGSDPLVADTHSPIEVAMRDVTGSEFVGADSSKHYLSLIATVRKNTPGWTLSAQAADKLEQLDSNGSSDHVVSVVLNDLGDFEQREWFYTVPINDTSRGFLRLVITG